MYIKIFTSLIALAYHNKMNVTTILNLFDLSQEDERALLYGMVTYNMIHCVYMGIFFSKKVCCHLAQKYADRKQRNRVLPTVEPFERIGVVKNPQTLPDDVV